MRLNSKNQIDRTNPLCYQLHRHHTTSLQVGEGWYVWRCQEKQRHTNQKLGSGLVVDIDEPHEKRQMILDVGFC